MDNFELSAEEQAVEDSRLELTPFLGLSPDLVNGFLGGDLSDPSRAAAIAACKEFLRTDSGWGDLADDLWPDIVEPLATSLVGLTIQADIDAGM